MGAEESLIQLNTLQSIISLLRLIIHFGTGSGIHGPFSMCSGAFSPIIHTLPQQGLPSYYDSLLFIFIFSNILRT